MMPPNSPQKDYYAVMGISEDASAHDIKMAYRRLARKFHPDLNKEADAEKNFKDLGEAYDVLKDPEKRKLYDQMRAQPQVQNNAYAKSGQDRPHAWTDWGHSTSSSSDFDADIFETLFGQSRPQKGPDLHGKISISLQEAFLGVEKDISLPIANKIQKLKVKIPSGVKSEQQIRLAGMGGSGQPGFPNGDLYLSVIVKRDSIFDLIGNDVYLTLPLAPWEAALGTTIKVPTLAGTVDLKIPPQSQGGQTLRLKKRGFPGAQPGDQLVLLKIVIPQPSTPAQIDLYKTMATEMAFNPRKHLENYHG